MTMTHFSIVFILQYSSAHSGRRGSVMQMNLRGCTLLHVECSAAVLLKRLALALGCKGMVA